MPHDVDVLVVTNIRNRRLYLGKTQDELGKSLGVTFQQIQKYEKGTNRVSASRLSDIAKALETTIGYFFGEELQYPERRKNRDRRDGDRRKK